MNIKKLVLDHIFINLVYNSEPNLSEFIVYILEFLKSKDNGNVFRYSGKFGVDHDPTEVSFAVIDLMMNEFYVFVGFEGSTATYVKLFKDSDRPTKYTLS